MNCPVCKETPMIVLEYDEVEVDYCTACHGVWLDAEEADLLFGDHDICMEFMSSGDPAQAPARVVECPICGKPMEQDVTAGGEPVAYDRCVDGDGVWFDEGELAHVMRAGHTMANGDKVEEFLRGLFGEPADPQQPAASNGAAGQQQPTEGEGQP